MIGLLLFTFVIAVALGDVTGGTRPTNLERHRPKSYYEVASK
jgi:hypothetical protein